MCPIKFIPVKALEDPWISNEFLEAFKNKDRLLQKAKIEYPGGLVYRLTRAKRS